jgi:aminoglycoside 6-adenylyltransferase
MRDQPEHGSELLDRFVNWTKEEDGVRALELIGSLAASYPSDELSDYDVVLFVTDVERYKDWPWQEHVGEVMHCLRWSDTGSATIFSPGVRFDIGVRSVDDLQRMIMQDPMPTINHVVLGYEFLVDKDGLSDALPPSGSRPMHHEKPTAAVFTHEINQFWHEAHNTAKYLARGDLWYAQYRDHLVKGRLLPFLEWHAHAIHGWDYDTAAGGKRVQSWVDADIWADVRMSFSGIDVEESWEALFVTIGLCRRIAAETADRLGYPFPEDLFDRMDGLVRHMKSRANEA